MREHQIFSLQSQWHYVKFKLQLLLANSNVQLVQVKKIPVQFDQIYESNHIKIDAALKATNMTEQQVQLFRININRNAVFQTGYFQSADIQNQRTKQGTQRMLLFKLAIGKTITAYKSQYDKQLGFPDGSDTIYFSEKLPQISLCSHQYRVKSPRQYALQYDVTYKIVKKPKFNPEMERCEYCKQNSAQIFCIDDKQFFCKVCYEQIHRSKQKVAHQSQKISPFNSVPICQIPSHRQMRKNKYCGQCRQLKCAVCIQKDHSHPNHTIMDVLQLSKLFNEKQRSTLTEIKSKLFSQIKSIQKKIQLINSEFETKQKQLQERFSSKITSLRSSAQSKIADAVAIHVQLKRRYDEYLWIEKFIEYCEPTLMTEDNIRMKEAFTFYIEQHSGKENFIKFDTIIRKL